MISVSRSYAGVQIEGACYAVSVLPVSEWGFECEPTLVLWIDARQCDFDDWVRLTTEGSPEFFSDEIQLIQTADGTDELRALHVDDQFIGFRNGFTLALEPGMRAEIEAALPRVERVTRLTYALGCAVEAHLERKSSQFEWRTLYPHEVSALVSIAANAVLDGREPETAIHLAVLTHDHRWVFSKYGDDPQYAEVGFALRQPDVISLLAEAATPAAAAM